MPVAQLITEMDPAVFQGLKSEDGELCTAEVTCPTGLEDNGCINILLTWRYKYYLRSVAVQVVGYHIVCAEEVQQKFGVQAHTATGRAFFDVALHCLPQVLELRSVENVHVVIHMQPNFPFTRTREDCFRALYALAEGPLWRKGIKAWQAVFGALQEDPFVVDTPLTKTFQEPNPVVDLRLLKKGSPIALNLPEDVKRLREQHSSAMACTTARVSAEPNPKLPSNLPQYDGVESTVEGSEERRLGSEISERICNGGSDPLLGSSNGCSITEQSFLNSPVTDSPHASSKEFIKQLENSLSINSTPCSTKTTLSENLATELEQPSLGICSETVSSGLHSHDSLKAHQNEGIASKLGNNLTDVRDDATGNAALPGADSQSCPGDVRSGFSFRVCCNRAGTDHVFGSPEAARQLGAAINDRFSWPVRLKDYMLEVILNITDNLVHISLGLTRQPLYRRNLVSFGPTNLRATLCYALVHLARPAPGDVVLDHMCGGASIPIEGALCFPYCFHMGGELHGKAMDRAATNLQHVESERGSALPAGLLRWDATNIPFRDSTVDVVVSDLPFGRRSGSKADNRTLYLQALRETARVVRPGGGRAVLLTHDRNSLIKNLALVREYWRNPSVRTINIGGLYAGVFLLCRTAAKYTGA